MSALVAKPAPEFTAQAVMPDGSFKEIKLMSQEVYASRVASEVVVPLIG